MKRLFFLYICLLISTSIVADTDVTKTYVENPDFEARFAGWINNGFYYVTNQSFSKKNGKIYMERWVASGSKIPDVEISQDLYLPAGTYTLKAGCQNIQQSGNIAECTGAILYAGDVSVPVTESMDYSVTFTVLQGVTRIGFKVTSTNANWAAIDNVRLTRLSTDIGAEHTELQKLIGQAEEILGEGEGAAELAASISNAQALIAAGSDEEIGTVAKRLNDATLNYRILNASGSTPRVSSTYKFVAAGATVLLGRMTTTPSSSSNILERGFCWSTSPEPTIFDNRSTRYFSANGEIYCMEKLQPGTMYYVRPYILMKTYKLAYGDIIKVPTLPKGSVTADYDNGGSTEENNRIASAMEEILWLYNNMSSVRGINLSIHYSAGTPTADCSYGGWMRVGANSSYQQTGTILHETNHGVGVGTSDVWWDEDYRADGNRGKWLGPRATQMIQFLNKDNSAYITGDDTHMWPSSSYSGPNYGINGSWEDTYNPENTLLYYGNVLITHALHQDGLVCSSEVGFASPAYTFAQDDETKYYIKTTDDECGNETSLLYAAANGALIQRPVSAVKAQEDDNYAWNIIYDPKTAYYMLRNVGSGRLLSCTSQQFKTLARTSPTASERVQLLPSRSNYKKGPINTSSYWITIGNTALRTTSKTAVGGTGFDSDDGNAKQHWLLLTAEEMTGFDQFCAEKVMPQLDNILAAVRESMETECEPLSEEVSLEEVIKPVTNLLAAVESEKSGYSVSDMEDAISNLRNTFIIYIGNVKPTSASHPIPISWLIENRGFDENAIGWTKGPETIKNGVAEFVGTTFNTYQVISPELPAGNYALTANVFQRPGTYQEAYTNWDAGKDDVKAQLYATGGGSTVYQNVQNIWDGACEAKKTGQCANYNGLFIPNNALAAKSWFVDGCYENLLIVSLPTASTLKIGIRSTKSAASWWTCFDNFALHYYGPYDVATSIDREKLIIDEGQYQMNDAQSSTWYDLNGRKLSGRPTQKGVYIYKGKRVLY
ncbi:MAG: hypothetical protein J6W52_05240 [Bacteroidaceae bacterium]|nr:hypothetical protein [Bacteroidaceae bacterium]